MYREHNYNFANTVPSFNFGEAFTRGPLDNSPVAPIGQGMASFFFGLPTRGQLNTNASLAEQSTSTGVYVQDDWRMTKKLSLNLGVRWDYDSPVTERFNRSVRGFEANVANPIEAAARAAYAQSPSVLIAPVDFRVRGGLTFAGADGQPQTLWRGDRNNIAPRFGVAYNVDSKLVLRGGYGVHFIPLGSDRQSVNQSMVESSENLQTPYLPKDTVAAYKALPDGVKVEVVKASIEMAKAVMRSPEFQALEATRVKGQFNAVNHKIALPAKVNYERQVWGRAAADAYRNPYVDSMKQSLQGDLRSTEFRNKKGMTPSAGEMPHEKVAEEIKKLLAMPDGDLVGFQKAYAAHLVARIGGPTDPVEVEKLTQEAQQKNWNEYGF